MIGVKLFADLCLRLAVNRLIDRAYICRCRRTDKQAGCNEYQSGNLHKNFDIGVCI
jgi:hypothetical protein